MSIIRKEYASPVSKLENDASHSQEEQNIYQNETIKSQNIVPKEKKRHRKSKKVKSKSISKDKDNKNNSEDNLDLDHAPLLLQPLESSMKKKNGLSKKGKGKKKHNRNEIQIQSPTKTKSPTKRERKSIQRASSKPIEHIELIPTTNKNKKDSIYSAFQEETPHSLMQQGRTESAKSIGIATKAIIDEQQLPIILLDPSAPKTPKPSASIRKKKSHTLIKKKSSFDDLALRDANLERRSQDSIDFIRSGNLIKKQSASKPAVPDKLHSTDMHTRDDTSSDDDIFDFGDQKILMKAEIARNEAKSVPMKKLVHAYDFQISLIEEPNDSEIEKKAVHRYDISRLIKAIKSQ